MKQLTALFMAGALASGCAATSKDRAIRFGVVSKEVVDGSAKVLRTLLEEKERECAPFVEESRARLVECLGPVASNPDAIDAAVDIVHAKQLALFLAVSADRDPAVIREAQNDLISATAIVVNLVKEAKGRKQ